MLNQNYSKTIRHIHLGKKHNFKCGEFLKLLFNTGFFCCFIDPTCLYKRKKYKKCSFRFFNTKRTFFLVVVFLISKNDFYKLPLNTFLRQLHAMEIFFPQNFITTLIKIHILQKLSSNPWPIKCSHRSEELKQPANREVSKLN